MPIPAFDSWLPAERNSILKRLKAGYLLRVSEFGQGLALLFIKGKPESTTPVRYEAVSSLIVADELELVEDGWYHGVYRLKPLA